MAIRLQCYRFISTRLYILLLFNTFKVLIAQWTEFRVFWLYSLLRGKYLLLNGCLGYETKLYLIVSFLFLRFEKCTLHFHYPQVDSGRECKKLFESHLRGHLMFKCSTMGVGRQSRRVCFGTKPDKGFLDKKISPYPEVVRGRERELTTRPRRGSWWLESREGSCGWTVERQLDNREARQHGIGSSDSESRWVWFQ